MTGYCEIVLWTDIKGEEAAPEVVPPSEICKIQYDFILVAILNKELSSKAIRLLIEDYDVDKKKILNI